MGCLLAEAVNRLRLPHWSNNVAITKEGLNEQLVQKDSHWMIHKICLTAEAAFLAAVGEFEAGSSSAFAVHPRQGFFVQAALRGLLRRVWASPDASDSLIGV